MAADIDRRRRPARSAQEELIGRLNYDGQGEGRRSEGASLRATFLKTQITIKLRVVVYLNFSHDLALARSLAYIFPRLIIDSPQSE